MSMHPARWHRRRALITRRSRARTVRIQRSVRPTNLGDANGLVPIAVLLSSLDSILSVSMLEARRMTKQLDHQLWEAV